MSLSLKTTFSGLPVPGGGEGSMSFLIGCSSTVNLSPLLDLYDPVFQEPLVGIMSFSQVEMITISQPHLSAFAYVTLSIQNTLHFIASSGENTYYLGFSSKATPLLC